MNSSSLDIIGSGAIGHYLYAAFATSYNTSLFSASSLKPVTSDFQFTFNGTSRTVHTLNTKRTSTTPITIYTGLLSSFPYHLLESSEVILCSNLAALLLPSKSFKAFSVIEYIQATLVTNNPDQPSLIASSILKPCLTTSIDTGLLNNSLIDIRLSQSSCLITYKMLRTLFYILHCSHLSGIDFDCLRHDFGIMSGQPSFIDDCLIIYNRLKPGFIPSILRQEPHQFKELQLFKSLFIEYLDNNFPSLLDSHTSRMLSLVAPS